MKNTQKHLSLFVAGVMALVSACAPSTSIKQKQGTTVKVTEKVESKYTAPKRRRGLFLRSPHYGAYVWRCWPPAA